MPTATSCRNRRRRPACASCARRELRRVRYASWSDCSECKARLATTVIYVYNTYMTKKLTITVSKQELRRAYAQEAAYEATRETEFKEEDKRWLDGLIGDALRAGDETR